MQNCSDHPPCGTSKPILQWGLVSDTWSRRWCV